MEFFRKLNYLLSKDLKIKMLGVLLLIILGSAAELLGVAIVLPIVNLAIDSDYSNNIWVKMVTKMTGVEGKEEILLILVGLVIIIYVIKNVYISWMYSRLFYYSAIVKRTMAVKLMKAYMKQPYAFFLKKNTSELIRSVQEDTSRLYEIVLNVLQVTSNGLTALCLLVTLIITNPMMTLMVFLMLSLCAVVIILGVQKQTRHYGRENQRYAAFLIQTLQQTFGGIKEVKILNAEKFFVKEYEGNYKEQTEVIRKYNLANTVPKYLIEMVCIVGIMLYLGFNIRFNANYIEIIPQLAVFVAAAYKLLPSVNAMYAYMNTIIYNRASLDVVYDDVKEANELPLQSEFPEEEPETMKFENEIKVSGVKFRYENSEHDVLENVSLTIPKGKSVAFIGASGGGKTTTADLILGILQPVEGSVLVDGVDIKENLAGWRKQIGYIPQTIYLSDDTIRNNIAWGISEKDIDEEKVWKALEGAQLADFVRSLDDGLDTVVGENGARISGGQKQRIGIARALYRNPEVLVFDEATSALDNETEKEVMKAIDALQGTKTMIMIAHRLTTIENCDMVYRVEKGKVERER